MAGDGRRIEVVPSPDGREWVGYAYPPGSGSWGLGVLARTREEAYEECLCWLRRHGYVPGAEGVRARKGVRR